MSTSEAPQLLDPYKNTREEYTIRAIRTPLPSKTHPTWLETAHKLRALAEKLAYHPAMAPNLQQTYMTPANDKNNVYFMWDFVSRTLGMLYTETDPQLKNGAGGKFADVLARNVMAKQLILDTKPGTLDRMTESTYPEQKGRHPQFGEEILALAREL